MSQHMDALARANEIRLARAELKRKIRTGETTVAHVLQDIPAEAATMALSDLLMAQHRWSTTRARRLCQSVTISETRALGRLTARERDRIARQLPVAFPAPMDWAA